MRDKEGLKKKKSSWTGAILPWTPRTKAVTISPVLPSVSLLPNTTPPTLSALTNSIPSMEGQICSPKPTKGGP